MRERRALHRLALIVASMAIGTLLTVPQPSRGGAAPVQRGGELTVLEVDDFQSLDPILASGPDYLPGYEFLLDFRRDAQGRWSLAPMLATHWWFEGNQLIMKIREGVKFHDGSDLNAEVVAWNITRMMQRPRSRAAGELRAIDRRNPAEARNPTTVQINLTRPSTGLLIQLSSANDSGTSAIVSRRAAEEHGEEWLSTNIVGTGPYRFVRFRAGDRLVMRRFDGYWQRSPDGSPFPYIETLTYRIIVEKATQLNEMRAGTADLMANVSGRDIPLVRRVPHLDFYEAVDSHLSKKRPLYFNPTRPLFRDNIKLRQAILHAIDGAAMARALSPGLGKQHPYTLVPGQIGYDPKVPYYEFNLEKAQRLMQEAGVSSPVEVRLIVHSRELDQRQAQLIQAMLRKIGVRVQIEVLDAVARGARIRSLDWELATAQDGADADPMDAFRQTSLELARPPRLQETLDLADAEINPRRRHELLVEAQRIVYETAWMGFMWLDAGNFVINKRVQNFRPPWNAFREWDPLWIKP
jgi:ABC-type transport system substrate-binding protein